MSNKSKKRFSLSEILSKVTNRVQTSSRPKSRVTSGAVFDIYGAQVGEVINNRITINGVASGKTILIDDSVD